MIDNFSFARHHPQSPYLCMWSVFRQHSELSNFACGVYRCPLTLAKNVRCASFDDLGRLFRRLRSRPISSVRSCHGGESCFA